MQALQVLPGYMDHRKISEKSFESTYLKGLNYLLLITVLVECMIFMTWSFTPWGSPNPLALLDAQPTIAHIRKYIYSLS